MSRDALTLRSVSTSADQQNSEQQQPDGAGEPAPPADGDADPEADHAGGARHREELPGVPAGAAGAAAEELAGGAERGAGHQHERPGGSRYTDADPQTGSVSALVTFL